MDRFPAINDRSLLEVSCFLQTNSRKNLWNQWCDSIGKTRDRSNAYTKPIWCEKNQTSRLKATCPLEKAWNCDFQQDLWRQNQHIRRQARKAERSTADQNLRKKCKETKREEISIERRWDHEDVFWEREEDVWERDVAF